MKHLEAIYGLGVQYEQGGRTINFLTSRLSIGDEVWSPLAWKSSMHGNGAQAPLRHSNWLHAWAPNAPKKLQSTVPNNVKQSQHYRLNQPASLENVSVLVKSLNMKDYPHARWKNRLVCCCLKWGICASLRAVMRQPRARPVHKPNSDVASNVKPQGSTQAQHRPIQPPMFLKTLRNPSVLSPPKVHNTVFSRLTNGPRGIATHD